MTVAVQCCCVIHHSLHKMRKTFKHTRLTCINILNSQFHILSHTKSHIYTGAVFLLSSYCICVSTFKKLLSLAYICNLSNINYGAAGYSLHSYPKQYSNTVNRRCQCEAVIVKYIDISLRETRNSEQKSLKSRVQAITRLPHFTHQPLLYVKQCLDMQYITSLKIEVLKSVDLSSCWRMVL